MSSFDLNQIKNALADVAWLDIMDPRPDHEGEKTGIRIKLAAPDSPAYRDLESAIIDRGLAKAAKRRNGAAPITSVSLEKEKIEFLVGITIDWEGVVFDGQEMPFTPENAKILYSEPRLRFLNNQVDAFASDRRNFFVN